jgi:hypothetical protein
LFEGSTHRFKRYSRTQVHSSSVFHLLPYLPGAVVDPFSTLSPSFTIQRPELMSLK